MANPTHGDGKTKDQLQSKEGTNNNVKIDGTVTVGVPPAFRPTYRGRKTKTIQLKNLKRTNR